MYSFESVRCFLAKLMPHRDLGIRSWTFIVIVASCNKYAPETCCRACNQRWRKRGQAPRCWSDENLGKDCKCILSGCVYLYSPYFRRMIHAGQMNFASHFYLPLPLFYAHFYHLCLGIWVNYESTWMPSRSRFSLCGKYAFLYILSSIVRVLCSQFSLIMFFALKIFYIRH